MAGWIGPTVAISLVIIAGCFSVIVFTMLATLKEIIDQATAISKEFQELRREMTPTLKYLGELGKEGADVAEMAKEEIREIVKMTQALRTDVQVGLKRTKRRLADFESVVEVVQEEIEETALDVGAALRSARTGAGVVGKVRRLLVPPQAAPPMKLLAAAAVVLLLMVCFPDAAHAWTPGTHVVLGETILSTLQLLPSAVADVLRAYPYDFLYGSIAADTTMAKKFAPADRHCHAWHVGKEVHDLAPSDALRAFGLGYIAHLAADVVAHNHYVPRQLVVTSSTRGMGHTYWESRVENVLGDAVPRAAKDLIGLDHRSADAHLERILSPTIFSVRTNRRLFRGMVRLSDSRPWQLGMQVASDQSRWDLTEELIQKHLDRATREIRSALADHAAPVYAADPNGEVAIMSSKQIRREALHGSARRDREELQRIAESHFGLDSAPATPLLIEGPSRQ